MNPLTTLRRIQTHNPCVDGWHKGLAALGPDLDAPISLGDIATSNDAIDTIWCLRALDWNDVAVRRAVIGGAVLPAVMRASVHTTDQRVHNAIAALQRWCAGEDVDLQKVHAAASASAADAAASASYAAAAASAASAAAHTAAHAAASAPAHSASLGSSPMAVRSQSTPSG